MKRLLLLSLLIIACTTIVAAQVQFTMATSIDTTTNMRYKSVDYLPGGIVWIAGGNNGASTNFGFRSTNDGVTWTTFTLPNTSVGSASSTGISNITALDANTAVIGLNTGEIIRTTNGGTKWDTVYSDPLGGWIDGVMFLNSTVAVAYGDADASGLLILRSTNAGASWTRITGLPGTLPDVGRWAGYYTYGGAMDAYNNTIWCSLYDGATINPHLAKSTDGGLTWADLEVVLPGGAAYDYRLHAIAFRDSLVGYGICRGLSSSLAEYVVKTTDGGVTWGDTISVQTDVWPHNLADPSNVKPIRGTNEVIALGGSGSSPYKPRAWRSTNGGTTWSTYNLSGWRGFVMNGDFLSSTQGFVVGTYFAYKMSLATGVDDAVVPPSGYLLTQNYPNPFNPVTNIRYVLPSESHVSLKVFDVLGRTIATVVDGPRSAGEHIAVFDGSSLPSGVYVYVLNTGNFTSARKMVLLK